MEEPIEEGGDSGGIAEQLAPTKEGPKKSRGLLKYRPSYFLAVKPGLWSAFAVDGITETPKLPPLPFLPRSSSLVAVAQAK